MSYAGTFAWMDQRKEEQKSRVNSHEVGIHASPVMSFGKLVVICTPKGNDVRNPQQSDGNPMVSGSIEHKRFVARIFDGAQSIVTQVMRLRASPLAAFAVPIALTLLVAVAVGTPHAYPTCPGVTPCFPVKA